METSCSNVKVSHHSLLIKLYPTDQSTLLNRALRRMVPPQVRQHFRRSGQGAQELSGTLDMRVLFKQ